MDDAAKKAREAVLEAIADKVKGEQGAERIERLAHAYAMTVSAKPESTENATAQVF